nr:MAG TPA_asm: hypothetical protein [Bacteriophage sp.]
MTLHLIHLLRSKLNKCTCHIYISKISTITCKITIIRTTWYIKTI